MIWLFWGELETELTIAEKLGYRSQPEAKMLMEEARELAKIQMD
jgi:hypothetical protein